jgi:hypothetical protein
MVHHSSAAAHNQVLSLRSSEIFQFNSDRSIIDHPHPHCQLHLCKRPRPHLRQQPSHGLLPTNRRHQPMPVAACPVFGSIAEDQSKWALRGDFMAAGVAAFKTTFDYPV